MANEYVGNLIPSPGFYKGNVLDDPELLYSYARFTQKGATLKAGQGVLKLGTVMAQLSTTKKWVAYDNGGSDGAGVARGVLRRGVDTGTDPAGPEYQGNIVISGILKNQLIVGSDSAAIADLNARVDDALDTFTI
jgi:head decoration protein D